MLTTHVPWLTSRAIYTKTTRQTHNWAQLGRIKSAQSTRLAVAITVLHAHICECKYRRAQSKCPKEYHKYRRNYLRGASFHITIIIGQVAKCNRDAISSSFETTISIVHGSYSHANTRQSVVLWSLLSNLSNYQNSAFSIASCGKVRSRSRSHIPIPRLYEYSNQQPGTILNNCHQYLYV